MSSSSSSSSSIVTVVVNLTVTATITITITVFSFSSRIVKFVVTITPSPPTKSLDFEGFDSSRLLILKGGNSHVR